MILYKYFPCNEYTYKSLAMRGLWCHYPRNMNDPFECLGVAERDLSEVEISKCKKIAAESGNPKFEHLLLLDNSKFREVFLDFRKKLIADFAFCSLSSSHDDILMWSHYANAHKGIVIGFEIDFIEMGDHLQKVEYLDELPSLNLNSVLEFLAGNDNYYGEFLKDISVKSKHWEKEQEYRIWRKGPCYYRFREDQIKELYFGVNCDLQTKKVVLELLNFLPDNFQCGSMKVHASPLSLVVDS